MATDHAGADLRGRSFVGDDLEDADFAGADLRGTDFSSARLAGASFRQARLGLPPTTGALIFITGLVFSVLAGIASGMAIDAIRDRLYGEGWERPSSAAGILLILTVFVAVMFWKGLDTAIKTFAITFAVVFTVSLIVRLIWGQVDLVVAARGVGLIVMLALALLAGILGRVIGGTFGAWAIAVVALIGGYAAGQAGGGLAALVVSISMVLISKRALRADPRDQTIISIAHKFVSRWGTRFAGADLTGADFAGTRAENCDTTGAVTADVTWEPEHAPLSPPH